MQEVLAVILGGGQGTRLYPLTKLRAKPAVPIGGKFRLIDIPISNCLHWGVKKIFVLTQFNTVSLHRHITNTYKFDGFSKGFLQILAAQQTLETSKWYQGTADAVRKNLSYIKNQDIRWVVILSGDQLYRINLRDLISFHRDQRAEITIAAKPVTREETRSFGILRIDGQRGVVDFCEKPQSDDILGPYHFAGGDSDKESGKNYLASMGIYVFDRDVLVDLLESNDNPDFGRQVIPEAIHRRRVSGYIFDGYWADIGTIKSFFEANLDFANPVPCFNFYDEQNPIFTRARFLPGSKVRQCQVNNALICDGSILEGSRISHAVIGIRSLVREGSVLDRVVMMGADYYQNGLPMDGPSLGIGKNCRITNAILDKNVRIGDDVIIDYRGRNPVVDHRVVDGIVVIEKNETIPDHTRIE